MPTTQNPSSGLFGPGLTAADVAAASAAVPKTFFDASAPNGGLGKLIASWQVNPLQSAITGTAVALSTSYPKPLPLDCARPAISTDGTVNIPAVFQARSAGGQCRAAVEIGDDAAVTAESFTPSITPASVAANTIAEQSFTCTGLTTLSRIRAVVPAASQAGLRIVAFRCDAADTLKITWHNTTGGAITPTAGTFTVTSARPTNGAQSSLFAGVGIYVRAPVREDGAAYTQCILNFYPDYTAVANRALCTFAVRADGKWRYHYLPWSSFGGAGTFVMGQSRFDYIALFEAGNGTAATLTAALTGGETSATLSAAFSGTTDVYPTRFSNGQTRQVLYTNGSAAITWGPAITSAATTAITRSTTLLPGGTTDTVQAGPVFRDPTSKAFAYIRLDDMLVDQYVDRQTLSTPFVGLSGVTLPTGVYSARSVCEAFGLKANLFILTSCIGKASGNFLSVAQMRDLQDRLGWDICFQTHANPAMTLNLGGRLLGPSGWNLSLIVAGGIASVDTTADTITTVSAHQFLTPSLGQSGLQGQPIEMTGTNLPAPLVTGTAYWTRPTTTTSFKLYPTELDSANNTNAIDLTTTGTPANFGYRYYGSAQDDSAFLADVRTGQAIMKANGFKGWQHIALNQGGWDYTLLAAAVKLRATDELRSLHGTVGALSVPTTSGYHAKTGLAYSAAGGGAVPAAGGSATALGSVFTHPQCYWTEGSTEAASRSYVDSLVMNGAVGGNYHHFFATEASLRSFCAYCDQIKLRVDQGLLLTGTMTDLWAYMQGSDSVS